MLKNAGDVTDPQGCPKEDNFRELYEELGNKEKQNEIRSQFPSKHHCFYLESDPGCCDVFNFPGARFEQWQGKMCPLNPKHPERISKERQKFHISKRDDELIAIASELARDVKMNPRIVSTLTTEEFYAASLYLDNQEFQNMKAQAILIANQVSKLFKKK